MKMIMGMFLVATVLAKREVLLAVVGNDAVSEAIGAEAVKNAVHGCPVDGPVQFGQYFIVAQGGTGVFKGGKHGIFGGGISAFHILLLRQCCNNTNFTVLLHYALLHGHYAGALSKYFSLRPAA
jgi:hypothetical protein